MPYQLRSRLAPGTPPTEPDASIPKRVDLVPLEPLFLGIDPKTGLFSGDDDEVGSSTPPIVPALVPAGSGLSGQDYSLMSSPPDLYDIDSRCPPVDLSTPKWQAAWEAELACLPTPPPTANKVINVALASSRPGPDAQEDLEAYEEWCRNRQIGPNKGPKAESNNISSSEVLQQISLKLVRAGAFSENHQNQ
ncbi:hypothetical protein NDA11_005750 [Ustilago hordei]|nr:hypothetical protein NDA11_005750 [Ustilago hordei]KAJ1602524.1 hypothetical protein NDA14_006261 [Ustilago hordei]